MTTVYTIGYEGTDIKRFVETLVAAKIDVLADVRAVPISRKKGFSKNALREALEKAGISYLHFARLGDPKPGRVAAHAGKFDVFREIYTKHLNTPDAQGALAELSTVVRRTNACLMCFERDPKHCHRNIISEQLAEAGILTFHLYGDSPSRYARNRELLPSRNTHQSRPTA